MISTTQKRATPGTVYTFYSFKGGAGRSMAVANVAALLGKWGRSVLVVDWDLEAPGIEHFFTSNNEEAFQLRASKPGLVDLVHAHAYGDPLKWRDCVLQVAATGVSIISAGQAGDQYTKKLHGLDFERLFDKHDLGSYIEKLRNEWTSEYEFVLVDSRTGVTDIGGICTVHLADVLVLLITTTDSSLEGSIEILERARRAQARLPLDRGKLIAVPVLARDESRTEYERATQWKSQFAERFTNVFADWLPAGTTPIEAVERMKLPYVPYWSFGERLPSIENGTTDPGNLGHAYEILARLLASRLDWDEAIQGETLPPPPTGVVHDLDSDWLARHRKEALDGLAKAGRQGFMEVAHFCVNFQVDRTLPELLEAAKQAAIHTFGWPIGIVLNSEEDRPIATADGIVARIRKEGSGKGWDYWTLRRNGDFFTLTSLFEDIRTDKAIFFNTRIVQVAEALLHCERLYKALGVEAHTEVRCLFRHGGLRGRRLGASSPERRLLEENLNRYEDSITSDVIFRIGRVDAELVGIVKQVCQRLFEIFDYASFGDETYEQIVTDFARGKVT